VRTRRFCYTGIQLREFLFFFPIDQNQIAWLGRLACKARHRCTIYSYMKLASQTAFAYTACFYILLEVTEPTDRTNSAKI
jgi:hypothetical protein